MEIIMKKVLEDKLILSVGTIIGLTIVDVIKEVKFDFKEFIIRTVVIAIVYIVFAFIELGRSKKLYKIEK